MKGTIKSKREFSRVFTNGSRVSSKLVRLSALKNEGNVGKVAFVAAKRLGVAPFRNTCKRHLREAKQMVNTPLEGYDIIFFATKWTAAAKPEAIAHDIERLLRKLDF